MSSIQTIDGTIRYYLQELVASGRRPKTLERHQTALGFFQQYLMKERSLLLLTQINEAEINGWMAGLSTNPTATGTFRRTCTVATYTRSMRAFCHWAAQKGYLQPMQFARGTLPRARKKHTHLIEPEEFDRLLQACGPSPESNQPETWATARNRAILWVLLDTGICVSGLCELRLADVDRERGRLRIRGKGERVRELALSPQGWHQVLCYLDEHRCKSGSALHSPAGEDYVFLTERYHPLTKNALTLLFVRLKTRAGLTDKPVSPSLLRDTFAVRYLLAGGEPEELLVLLGLQDPSAIKRYERLRDQVCEKQKPKAASADHPH